MKTQAVRTLTTVLTSLRLTAATLALCAGLYTVLILAFALCVAPDLARGSLIRNTDGTILGSRLVSQKFSQPGYFWPRPSAADFNAAAAAGSNLSPTSPTLSERAQQAVSTYGATPENPLPADLATASGSGLDPHITERAAAYQIARVAQARGLPPARVKAIVERLAFAPGGGLTPDRLLNVLELNLALDALEHPGP